jgi:Tat protein translocase TatB subunit
MFGLGFGEIIIVLVIALLFIGPKKLPEVAKALGRGMREFQKVSKDFKDTMAEAAREAEVEAQKLEEQVKADPAQVAENTEEYSDIDEDFDHDKDDYGPGHNHDDGFDLSDEEVPPGVILTKPMDEQSPDVEQSPAAKEKVVEKKPTKKKAKKVAKSKSKKKKTSKKS